MPFGGLRRRQYYFLLVVDYQREQEWNISRKELLELVKVGVLEETDIDEAIAVKFNPVSLFIFYEKLLSEYTA